MASRYVVGIDLGTTHTVLAFADTEKGGSAVEVFEVPQLVGPGEVAALPLLASTLYLPGEHELPAGALKLPWSEPAFAVGHFARLQAAKVPGKVVQSAKSWLCHEAVDRTKAILPWGAPETQTRASPVEASARYLAHLREAWDARFPKHRLAEQEVVLTVPASFDDVARELTIQAAKQAGIPQFVLLEEPQAAFYDFVARHTANLAGALGGAAVILVVDVGGGTTDLTLVHAKLEGGKPVLERLAVGDHLLLGGDNMDILLARTCEARLATGSTRLDATQWSQLVAAARQAKEQLLSPGAPEKVRVAIAGRGSKLVGGTLSTELTREEVRSLVVEGFFPRVESDAPVQRGGRSAIQELGLPFVQDPAIPRHVAAFLRAHRDTVALATGNEAQALPRPDAVLFNGGVFNAPVLQERLLEVLSGWFPERKAIGALRHESLDLAVACGASHFGRVRRGEGVRIGGGSARTYALAITEADGTLRGLCVVPKRQPEGTDVEVAGRTFALTLQRPVRFALHASTQGGHALGDVLELGEGWSTLPPIETVLTGPAGLQGELPVKLVARLSEVGTLELSCVSQSDKPAFSELRWNLAFPLRGEGAREGATRIEPLPKRWAEARELVELVFGKRPQPVGPREVKDLIRNCEKVLGPRETWSAATCRELWSETHAGFSRRRRSADHERVWCQLAGYALRPGFGHPLDAWRVGETWKAFAPGLQFHPEAANWGEWWVMWRRLAGGLDEAAHVTLAEALLPHLAVPAADAKAKKPKGIQPQGFEEMVRLAGALERLPAARKFQLGEALCGRLLQKVPPGEKPFCGHSTLVWALGRLGARAPLYGSAHVVLSPDSARAWLEMVLASDWSKVDSAPLAAMQLARVTGDRARDLDPELRERVALRLEKAGAVPEWVTAVREHVAMEKSEEARILGESLPAGLRLLG